MAAQSNKHSDGGAVYPSRDPVTLRRNGHTDTPIRAGESYTAAMFWAGKWKFGHCHCLRLRTPAYSRYRGWVGRCRGKRQSTPRNRGAPSLSSPQTSSWTPRDLLGLPGLRWILTLVVKGLSYCSERSVQRLRFIWGLQHKNKIPNERRQVNNKHAQTTSQAIEKAASTDQQAPSRIGATEKGTLIKTHR